MKQDKLSDRILRYLKENPGSTPREIADSIGVSISTVRRILYFLRDKGLVKRLDRGYVAVSRVSEHKETNTSRESSPKTRHIMEEDEVTNMDTANIGKELMALRKVSVNKLDDKWLYEIISNIMKQINNLEQRLKLLEKELEFIKKIISKETSKQVHQEYVDKLIEIIKHEKIIPLSTALNYATKPLEYYVEQKLVIPLGKYIVDYAFYVKFKEKIPIRTDKIKLLDEKEKQLLRILIDEGIVYLHKGQEYRMINSESN